MIEDGGLVAGATPVEDQCSFLSVLLRPSICLARARKCAASLHACVSYVFNGTLARRKKTILGELAIIIRVRHDTPHSLNRTKRSSPHKRRNEKVRMIVAFVHAQV
jgi:hypothetical protein